MIRWGSRLMFLQIFGDYKHYRQNYLDSLITLSHKKTSLDYKAWSSFISVSEVQKAGKSILLISE